MAGKPAKQGAIWFLYYPNVMLEWYPHVLVVSTLLPRSPTHTTNVVEFYYPEDIVLFEREFARRVLRNGRDEKRSNLLRRIIHTITGAKADN